METEKWNESMKKLNGELIISHLDCNGILKKSTIWNLQLCILLMLQETPTQIYTNEPRICRLDQPLTHCSHKSLMDKES